VDCIALSPLGGIYRVQRLGGKVPTRYIWQSDLPNRAQPPVEIDLPGGAARVAAAEALGIGKKP